MRASEGAREMDGIRVEVLYVVFELLPDDVGDYLLEHAAVAVVSGASFVVQRRSLP